MKDLSAILFYIAIPLIYTIGYGLFSYFGWWWGFIGGVSLVYVVSCLVNKKTSPA